MLHDPFYEPAVLANPHAMMVRLRETEPVKATLDPNGQVIFLVTSLTLIEDVGRRMEDFSSKFGHLLMAGNAHPEVAEILMSEPLDATLLLNSDNPDHKRLRSLVNAAFATGRVANMAPMIEQLIDELIDGFVETGHCDFVAQFAVLLPTYIIADVLGLPRLDYNRVKLWSDAVIGLVGRQGTKEEEIEFARIIVDTRRYLRDMVVSRRGEPRDDLISNLIHVHVEGVTPLTDREVTSLAFETSVAGNETTRNTLMSGLVQLLRHPQQLQALIDDPALVPRAVEEILRYETPANSMWRIARHDTELGGVPIPAGAVLMLRYDGGSRDPARFADPETFDITRRNAHQHIAFGPASPHRCLGQMLARKELVLAFPRLLNRLKNLRVAASSSTDYQPSLMFHTIGSLDLDFTPGPKVHARATPALV